MVLQVFSFLWLWGKKKPSEFSDFFFPSISPPFSPAFMFSAQKLSSRLMDSGFMSCFTAIGTWWHIGNQGKSERVGMHWRSKKSDRQRQKKVSGNHPEKFGKIRTTLLAPGFATGMACSRAMMPKCSILCIFWTAIWSCFFWFQLDIYSKKNFGGPHRSPHNPFGGPH